MERDLRETPVYKEVEEYFRRAHEPAFGRFSGAEDLALSPDGTRIAFTGSRRDKLEGLPTTRVCMVDVETGALDEATAGPNNDSMPRWSPDGSRLAFVSDRSEKGRNQLYLLTAGRLGEAVKTPEIKGSVEYFSWSPDGRAILLAVAGSGADLAGVQGSGAAKGNGEKLPDWMPQVETAVSDDQWRRLWLYDVAAGTSRPLSGEKRNIWEAAWAGRDRVVAIVSDSPGEDAWYGAPLVLIDGDSGAETVLYQSDRQLGLPASSPDGSCIAAVQALCSDRAVIAGDILLFDGSGGEPKCIDTGAVDVTWLGWRDDKRLAFGGIRQLSSVFGEYDTSTGQTRELWSSQESTGSRYPRSSLAPGQDSGTTLAITLQSYERFPEIGLVRDGAFEPVLRLAHDGSEHVKQTGGTIEEVSWTAPDGLEIQGLLVRPAGSGPQPLVVNVHGGPVATYQNHWLMTTQTPLLASRGYAVLHPNPRGGSGRGQAFAEMVYGDMGGKDTGDILAGIDAMVARDVADPEKIGVMGGSYGGFMSSWIITQDQRFAAAVPISPVTDWFSQHYTSNISSFDRDFLQDDPVNAGGKYFERSPITHACRAKTPTLQTAGSNDRCTPPTQAVEFHRALVEHGVESVLIIYPQEGHGVRQFPATIDISARIVSWFERFMPPGDSGEPQ